jgi:hypothetical protein
MSTQRNGSLCGLAAVSTKRIVSVRQFHAERGDPPAAEVARQFAFLCKGARLQDSPVTTVECWGPVLSLKRSASRADHARTLGVVRSLIIVISWWPTG